MSLILFLLAILFVASLAGGFGSCVQPWTALFLLSGAAFLRLLHNRREEMPWFERVPGRTIFFLCLSVYLSTFRWHGGDDIPNSLLPYCILGHGTLTFDPFASWAGRGDMRDLMRFVNGHWFSTYPVAPGVLALPLYLLPVIFRVPPTDVFLHNLAKIAGAGLTALSAAVLWRVLEGKCSRRWAAAVTLLYAFGSYAFSVSSQALYSHGPAQLGVALGLLGMASAPGNPLLSGFGFGLAVVSREDSLAFLAAGGLFFLLHRRDGWPRFLAGAAAPLSLNLAYWFASTGRLQPPYFAVQSGQFTTFSVRALAATLLSPGRGLAFFFPAAAFSAWGAWLGWRRGRRPWIPYLAAACAAVWVFYGFRYSWTGGNTFGNRYFSVVCLVLAVFCADAEELVRGSRLLSWSWAAAFAVCVSLHAMGAYFNWPGSGLTLAAQESLTWSLYQFPPIHLFTADGALGGLDRGPRAVMATAFLALSIPLACWMRRFIRPEADPSARA